MQAALRPLNPGRGLPQEPGAPPQEEISSVQDPRAISTLLQALTPGSLEQLALVALTCKREILNPEMSHSFKLTLHRKPVDPAAAKLPIEDPFDRKTCSAAILHVWLPESQRGSSGSPRMCLAPLGSPSDPVAILSDPAAARVSAWLGRVLPRYQLWCALKPLAGLPALAGLANEISKLSDPSSPDERHGNSREVLTQHYEREGRVRTDKGIGQCIALLGQAYREAHASESEQDPTHLDLILRALEAAVPMLPRKARPEGAWRRIQAAVQGPFGRECCLLLPSGDAYVSFLRARLAAEIADFESAHGHQALEAWALDLLTRKLRRQLWLHGRQDQHENLFAQLVGKVGHPSAFAEPETSRDSVAPARFSPRKLSLRERSPESRVSEPA